MPRIVLKTVSRVLPAFDFWFFVVTMILVMPFLTCRSALDPGLAPRSILWAGTLLVVLSSFLVQAVAGDLSVDCIVRPRILFFLFLGYLLLCLVSLQEATNLGEGLYDCARVFLSVLFLPVSIVVLGRKSTCVPNLARAVVVSAVVLSVIGCYQYVNCSSTSAIGSFAMTGTLGNKNLFASALFLMLPYCLYVLARFNGFWRLAGAFATGAILSAVLLSRTRSVWLALCVSSILTVTLCLLRRYRYGMKVPQDVRSDLVRGACLILIVVLVLAGGAWGVVLRTRATTGMAGSILDTESIAHRLAIWKKTLAIVRDHCMFGVGVGNWKIIVPSYGIPNEFSDDEFNAIFYVRPHNDFLWVLSEAGVVAFCLYVSIFVVLMFYLLRFTRHCVSVDDSLLSLLIFFGMTGYLVISMFSFPRERVLHSVFLLLLAAILHIVYRRNFPPAGPCSPPVVGGFMVLAYCLLPAVAVLGCVRLNAECHIRRALSARAAGDYHAAIAEIDKAYSRLATLDPTATPLKWYRGEGLFLSGRHAEALDDYKQALADHPYHIHTLNNLATCYQITGNRDMAIFYYQRLLDLFPRFVEATCNLAAVHFNAGEYEKARDTLLRSDLVSRNALVERYHRIVADRLAMGETPAMVQATTRPEGPVEDPPSYAAGESLRPLHRLWSATRGRYFYTVDTGERDVFLACQHETWVYEGVDSYVFADDCVAGLCPVHRFYLPESHAYFYTIQSEEVQMLIKEYEGRWQYEGISFFVFPAGRQPAGAWPVYRFWSGNLRYHLFTINQKEKENLQTRHSDVWAFEGIAWYAYR